MNQDAEALRGCLKSRRLKLTKTRLAVFREITAFPDAHVNAYDIHERLRKRGLRVSLATVYRTLSLLVEAGLVSQIDLGENHSHYEPETAKTSHGHFICLSCGNVHEFNRDRVRSEIATAAQEMGFQPGKISIQVFGFCRSCRKS